MANAYVVTDEWKKFLREADIPIECNEEYTNIFLNTGLKIKDFLILNDSHMEKMGLNNVVHIARILAHGRKLAKKNDEAAVGGPSKDSSASNEVVQIINALKDINIRETIEDLQLLKRIQRELHIVKIERGYAYVGEAACVILDSYTGKKRASIENESPNKKKKMTLKKPPNSRVSKPELSEYIKTDDFVGLPPLQKDFDIFLGNCRDVRHGLDHLAKYEAVENLRTKYDELEQSLENLGNGKEEIIEGIDKVCKKLAPTASCPGLETIKLMKPYF